MRASLPVKLAFNATGRAASRGGIIRAGIVVVMSAALVVAVMAGLTRTAKAADRTAHLGQQPFWSLALAFARHHAASTDATCLPASIKAALAKANAACGITVISTLRPGAHIAGTGHVSMHASCRAADFSSHDYPCVYRLLSNWPGKLSVDALRMRHVHRKPLRLVRRLRARPRKPAPGRLRDPPWG